MFFDLFGRRPFWFTCSLLNYSAKLLPGSFTFANGFDQYSLAFCLHFNDGSYIQPSAFSDIFGDEHSSTLVDHSLGRGPSPRISGKRRVGLVVKKKLIGARFKEIGPPLMLLVALSSVK